MSTVVRVDGNYGSGDEILGLRYLGLSSPSKWYARKRGNLMIKGPTLSMKKDFDTNLSITDNMFNMGFRELWNVGYHKYVLER